MLSVSVNSVPLWLIIVAEKLPWRFTGVTTESQSARRTNGRRRLSREAIGWAFLGWMERNAERLSELCASVVSSYRTPCI